MKRSPQRKYTLREEKQIARDRVAGLSIDDLCAKWGPVAAETVVGILVEQGVFQRKKVRDAAAGELPDFGSGEAA